MIRLPTINSKDTEFTRQLKQTIIELHRQLRRQRIRGDGATFSVTGGPGGLIGHAVKNQMYAKIIDEPSDGRYEAEEVIYDESASAWITKPNGLTWDNTTGNQDYLYELNATTGIEADTIVSVHKMLGDEGTTLFYFEVSSAGGIAPIVAYARLNDNVSTDLYDADEMIFDDDANTWIVKTGGLNFNGSDAPYLREVNGKSDIADDTIVAVFQSYGDDGDTNYFFQAPEGSEEVIKQRWIAKITSETGLGVYSATEVHYDDANDEWDTKPGGETFGTLTEYNFTTGIANDSIVSVFANYDDYGDIAYFFNKPGTDTLVEQPIYEATADESGGTITARRINLDGTLTGATETFDVLGATGS